MSRLNFLTSQIENKKRDYSIYACPFCGTENKINSSECKYCTGPLLEFEAIIFSNYNLYNEALECAKNNDYISALEKITIFLKDYKEDISANRLKFYILKKINDKNFEQKAESYIAENQDRWVASLVDNSKNISIKDLPQKENFNGQVNNLVGDPITITEQTKRKLTNDIKETINALYSIYIKAKSIKKKKDKLLAEFVAFYEKTFLLFLKKQDIHIIDLYGQNFNNLEEEIKKCIGNVDTITNKKLKDGYIAEVYFPEIHYKNFIIQKAKITIIKNN